MKALKEEKNIQIVVRLSTNKHEPEKKNSILTLWKIKERTYRQFIRNKENIFKKLDSNE